MSLLTGETYYWWDTVKQGTTTNHLMSDFFLRTFKKKFLGEQYMKARKWEFINLVQGELYVAEYEAEFVRLSQYAVEMA